MDSEAALKLQGQYRDVLTRKQLLTLRGQIKSGDVDGAVKGLTRIIIGGTR